MSKKMKLLMENFNKFLEEEEGEMDMGEDDSTIDSILDDILGSSMMEGLLKEMFPTPEDVADGDEIMGKNIPTKEEVKSDIKTALKAPEVKAVLSKMSEETLRDQDIQAGLKSAIAGYGNELKLAAASIPGISILGAILGAFKEPVNAMYLDPSVLEPIIAGNIKFGAAVGAVIGAAFLSTVVVDFIERATAIKKSREDARKST